MMGGQTKDEKYAILGLLELYQDDCFLLYLAIFIVVFGLLLQLKVLLLGHEMF